MSAQAQFAISAGGAPQLIGTYRVQERLGEGGMGEVVRAVDIMLEREVALKTLRPEMAARSELVERFRVEAIALARLHHRHIAAVYAFFREADRYHMAMQYVRGRTLEAVLRERVRLPWREAAAVALDVLLALEHAHALGVVHRDLKPANLMVDHEGRTVVMDFGIARVLAKGRQTRAGTLVGTLEYIAPEIVRGADADARSDLYSLGCVLYEMVTGELPFEGASDFALMRAHAEQAPPRPRTRADELPAELESIILRALAKRPEDRFTDAKTFRAALLAACGDAPARLRPSQRKVTPTWFGQPLQQLQARLNALAVWLELPRSGNWQAWRPWLRQNPGLAGAALVALSGIVLTTALATWPWWRPVPNEARTPMLSQPSMPTAPAQPEPAVLVPVAATPERAPETPLRDAPVPVAARPAPAAPVYVMPPAPKPRVSVERPVAAPPSSAPPVRESPAAPPRAAAPAESPAELKGKGWYVKH